MQGGPSPVDERRQDIWLPTLLGLHPPTCNNGDLPDALATATFVIMILGFAGRALWYGEEVRHVLRSRIGPGAVVAPVSAICVAFGLQLGVCIYYFNRYRRCDSVRGLFVFLMVCAFSSFLVHAVARPVPLLRCRWIPQDDERDA